MCYDVSIMKTTTGTGTGTGTDSRALSTMSGDGRKGTEMKKYTSYVGTSEEKDAIESVDFILTDALENQIYPARETCVALLKILNRGYARCLRAEMDTTTLRIPSKNIRNLARALGYGELDSCKYRKLVQTTDVSINPVSIAQLIASMTR